MRATKAQFDELGGLVDTKPRKFKDDDKSIVKLPDEFKPMWEKSSNPFYKNIGLNSSISLMEVRRSIPVFNFGLQECTK